MNFREPAQHELALESATEKSIAAACLVHPYSLLSLFILACNDHWFKGVGPSWLTGKLSDFAGLFYFPFLVILLVTWILPRLSRNRLPIGHWVFPIVGIWFAATKTIPLVHTATSSFAELFVGKVQIMRDPGDVIAILSLIPAWFLYKHISDSPPKPAQKRLQPLTLCVTVLLTAATSQPRTPSVNQLIVYDGKLYAQVGNSYSPEDQESTYSSLDGLHWLQAELPPEIIGAHKQRTILNTDKFRIELHDTYIDINGTRSWDTSDYRNDFMQLGDREPWQTLDVAVLPGSPHVIVIALGNEGVLVFHEGKGWTRHGVGGAQPTPDIATPGEAVVLTTQYQWLFGVSSALLTWVLLSFLTWNSAVHSNLPHAQLRNGPRTFSRLHKIPRDVFRTLTRLRFERKYVLIALAAITVPFLTFIRHLGPVSGESMAAMIATPFLFLSMITTALGWRRFKKTFDRPYSYSHIPLAIFSGLVANAMLFLWDIGWIRTTPTAFLLSAGTIALVVCVRAANIANGRF